MSETGLPPSRSSLSFLREASTPIAASNSPVGCRHARRLCETSSSRSELDAEESSPQLRAIWFRCR